MHRPQNAGAFNVDAIAADPTAHGYDGWHTLEQETVHSAEPPSTIPAARSRTYTPSGERVRATPHRTT
ncbi:hypothetical protein ACO0M4_10710 [Streptomyces sp. RGM 3693]|uniref:hypothetical protein n=1 Tax=Streptomyces sp. RGM 3693 TaxID=3413284 RepID=UPI003D27D2A4